MLDRAKHKRVMVSMLKEVYADARLRKCLGFKGGTAAMLFYDLPRMSVDLDFDLLNGDKQEEVFEKLGELLPKFGEVHDQFRKRWTLFWLVNYERHQRNIKIEISCREKVSEYEVKDYLGISMQVMKQDDMVANKLVALISRKSRAARDFFDLYFFLKEGWEVDGAVVEDRLGWGLEEAFSRAIEVLDKTPDKFFLQGMGELLEEKQKDWVRRKFREELMFQLRLRIEE